jgi:hypothetical protein
MTEPKNRSRILILSYIAQFSLGCDIGGRPYSGLSEHRFREDRMPLPGTLVAITSAKPSKWYLSWVIEAARPPGWDCERYTLESIEDGEVSDWHNVGIWAYDRRTTDEHPEWRWTDAQHEFNDRWTRLCRVERDTYIHKPVMPVFGEDGSVVLGTRMRWSEARPTRTLPDWRSVSDADMLEFYDWAVATAEAEAAQERDDAKSKG